MPASIARHARDAASHKSSCEDPKRPDGRACAPWAWCGLLLDVYIAMQVDLKTDAASSMAVVTRHVRMGGFILFDNMASTATEFTPIVASAAISKHVCTQRRT